MQANTNLYSTCSALEGSRAKATWTDVDIALCTIKKANSLVNATIEDGKSDQLGIIVMDELHMLDDENRGYLIKIDDQKVIVFTTGNLAYWNECVSL